MPNLIRAAFSIIILAFLAACADPGPPIKIRSGIGQEADLDALRPPSGAVYRYVMEMNGVTVPAELRLLSRRLNATTYDYNGSLILTLPKVENLAEIRRLVARSFEVRDIKVRVRGNSIVIPVTQRSDNRFRSSSSSIALTKSRYSPHDCFAVLGTCRYVASQDGRSVALISETTEKNGVWRSKTRVDPAKRKAGQTNEVRRSTYSIDQNGVLIDMIFSSISRGERSTMVLRRK